VPGLFFLLLGFVQPLYLLVAYAVLATHVAALFLLQQPVRQAILAAAISTAISSPLVIYTAYMFRADPILAQWQRQNIILSPPPLDYLFAWGIWLAPALIVAAHYLARRSATSPAGIRRWFLLAWLAIVPVLIYLPYNLQRRFAEGAQLPLVCLAVIGLTSALSLRLRRRRRRQAAALVIALSLPTSAFLLIGGALVAAQPDQPVFVPDDQVEVMRWLGAQAQRGDTVLASFQTGNALPAYAPVVSYLGHGPETAFADRKVKEVEAFFVAEADDDFRRTLLQVNRIRFVVFDQTPRPGLFDPASADYLAPAYQAGERSVYSVMLTGTAAE
jgi:hypothetical protein